MNTYQAKLGHARTSTVDQNLDAQIQVLTSAERVANGRGFKFPAEFTPLRCTLFVHSKASR